MTENNTKLVVTHIISGDLWAGAEVQVYNLCRALQASGQITPTAVVFNKGILFKKLKELGISVSLADEKKLGPWAIARSIAFHCKTQNSKVVHTHGFKENVLGVLGKDLARVPSSVRTVHGNPETAFTFKRLHKWLIQKLDLSLGRMRQQAVIAVSTQLERSLLKSFPGKVYKIFNFIDVENIHSEWGVVNRSRNSELQLGIIGRLVSVKRVDIFIKTVEQLNKQGIPCTGSIVGTGPLESTLRSMAKERNIDHKITFKGFINPALGEMCLFDVLLMTSDHEGLPMALLEALALGVPIIAHYTGGIPEVLSFGKGGFLVTDHSPSGYAKMVKHVIESPDQVAIKIKEGLNVVKREFDKKAQSEKYVAIYRQIS
ncbi:glycosyltransferase [Marinobacter salarius]|uniref:glycosyltransferase n=1 Tax=Marinobacter salarius TaxID=1420917 RepID=UPI003D0FE871